VTVPQFTFGGMRCNGFIDASGLQEVALEMEESARVKCVAPSRVFWEA